MIEAQQPEQATSVALDPELRPQLAEREDDLSQPNSVKVLGTAFVVLFCVVGLALWGLPFFYDFMVQQFGWTRAQVTSGNAVSKLIVGPVVGFIAGWIVDRFGPRRLMISGVAMISIALIGLGSISSLPLFYVFYFFNALGYVCGGPLPVQVLLSRWFTKSRGKAMGIAYLGISVGGASIPWIAHFLVQQFGWQMALRIIGALIFCVSFPLVWFLKEMPSTQNRTERKQTPDETTSAKRAFMTFSFFLLIAGSMCSIAAVSGTQQSLKLFLSLDRHYSQGDSAQVLSLVLGASIFGRLLMGWLADRFPKKYVMILTYLLVAAGIPLFFLGETHFAVNASAVVFGIGLGGDYMIIPLITAELFGLNILGRLMGVLLTAGGMAEAASPWLVSWIRDMTGSYSTSCIALIGFAILGVMAILALPERRHA